MRHCYTTFLDEFAVHATAGEGRKGENGLLVVKWLGADRDHKVYFGNAARAVFDGLWVETKKHNPLPSPVPESCCAFVNHGNLELTDMLGVPMPFRKTSARDMSYSGPVKDYCWVDNYGSLYSFNNRFGGEWGGHCAIYCRAGSRTYVEGGTGWFTNPRSHKALTLAFPGAGPVLVRNVVCAPYNNVPATSRLLQADGTTAPSQERQYFGCIPAE
jgi:hypothetical protein